VQSKMTSFQHRNAQPRHLRDPPHRTRSRSLTPHRRCPCYGGISAVVALHDLVHLSSVRRSWRCQTRSVLWRVGSSWRSALRIVHVTDFRSVSRSGVFE
jgi:hypothetical protein